MSPVTQQSWLKLCSRTPRLRVGLRQDVAWASDRHARCRRRPVLGVTAGTRIRRPVLGVTAGTRSRRYQRDTARRGWASVHMGAVLGILPTDWKRRRSLGQSSRSPPGPRRHDIHNARVHRQARPTRRTCRLQREHPASCYRVFVRVGELLFRVPLPTRTRVAPLRTWPGTARAIEIAPRRVPERLRQRRVIASAR